MSGVDRINLHFKDWKGRTEFSGATDIPFAVKFEYWNDENEFKEYQFQGCQQRIYYSDDVTPGGADSIGLQVAALEKYLTMATFARRKKVYNQLEDVLASGSLSLAAPVGHYFSRALVSLPELSGDVWGSGEFQRVKRAGFYAFGNAAVGMEPTRELPTNSTCLFPMRGDANLLSVYVRSAQPLVVKGFYWRFPRIWIADEDQPTWTLWRYNDVGL